MKEKKRKSEGKEWKGIGTTAKVMAITIAALFLAVPLIGMAEAASYNFGGTHPVNRKPIAYAFGAIAEKEDLVYVEHWVTEERDDLLRTTYPVWGNWIIDLPVGKLEDTQGMHVLEGEKYNGAMYGSYGAVFGTAGRYRSTTTSTVGSLAWGTTDTAVGYITIKADIIGCGSFYDIVIPGDRVLEFNYEGELIDVRLRDLYRIDPMLCHYAILAYMQTNRAGSIQDIADYISDLPDEAFGIGPRGARAFYDVHLSRLLRDLERGRDEQAIQTLDMLMRTVDGHLELTTYTMDDEGEWIADETLSGNPANDFIADLEAKEYVYETLSWYSTTVGTPDYLGILVDMLEDIGWNPE